MPFSLPGAGYIEEKIAFGVSLVKCAWELLSERLADAHTNVDDSHSSNRASLTKSILQHGRLETALLSAAVENVACVVFLNKHGLLEVSDRVLPMVRFRTRATLEFICDYLAQRVIFVATKTGGAAQNTAAGKRVMHFALSHTVALRTTHSELCNLFGDDYIRSTLRYAQSLVERVLVLLADTLNKMNDTIAYKSQRSMVIWMMYTLARSLFAINLCSISITLAFLSGYTCETRHSSLVTGVLQLSSSAKDLPADVSIIVSMTSASDILEYDTTTSVAPSPNSQVASVDDDTSILATFPDIVPFITVDRVEKTAENKINEIDTLNSKETGLELSRPKENDNQIFEIDVDDDVQERKTGDVAPRLFEVELDTNGGTNESIKIIITSSLGADKLLSSLNEQDAPGVFDNSENNRQSGSSTAYDNTASESSNRGIGVSTTPEGKSRITEGILEMDLGTPHGRRIAKEIPPSNSNNHINDANKENRFCPKSRDRSLSSEVRAWGRHNPSLSEQENDPDITVRQKDKGKGKERTDESSPIDILEELFHSRFDQALVPTSKAQIGAKASFSVHLDADVRQLTSSQSPPTEPVTETRDRPDLFSIDTSYHEEKYKIKSRMPPINSKLYDKYLASAPDVSINKNDELQISTRIPLESVHGINSNASTRFLTPHSPIFVPRHMRTNGFENRTQPLPLHWSPAVGGPIPIVVPTSRRRARLGALATGDKRKDNLTRRTLS